MNIDLSLIELCFKKTVCKNNNCKIHGSNKKTYSYKDKRNPSLNKDCDIKFITTSSQIVNTNYDFENIEKLIITGNKNKRQTIRSISDLSLEKFTSLRSIVFKHIDLNLAFVNEIVQKYEYIFISNDVSLLS